MPKIDADEAPNDDNVLMTSMTYGVSRVGKTTLASTFPAPAIFASMREGGYRSVQTMDRAMWYDPKVKPLIFAVSNMKEAMGYFKEVEVLIRSGRVKTIVLELSFYSDDVIKTTITKDSWAKYRILDDHIMWIDAAAKKLGVRIAYNALAADASGDAAAKSPAGIQVAGKSLARKLPAATDLTAYLRTEDKGNNQIDRILHLLPYGSYPAGHRYGARLPTIVRNPTYRKLEDLILGRAHADDLGNVLPGPPAVTVVTPPSVDDLPDLGNEMPELPAL